MTSIDDLFKNASTTSNKKRKLETNQNASEIFKATKLSPQSDVKTNGAAEAGEDNLDDVEAGPEMPPEGDEDQVDDDEDGRFFGSGVNKNTVEALNYIDGQEAEQSAPEVFNEAWLRKLALNFEKRISKNAELRARFESDPQKFMGSEADLDADIKSLSILSEHSDLYPEFAKLGCVASLTSLLSHENTDIAIDSIEIIDELLDDDVSASLSDWDALVDGLLDADLLDLLHSNLTRLDETIESDRAGVYHILSVLGNLSSRPSIVTNVGESTQVLPWLVTRIQAGWKEKDQQSSGQNTAQASELLNILLQNSSTTRKKCIALNAIETFLNLLAPYRKRDPERDSDEEEFVSNIFNSTSCCVDESSGKGAFLEAEGVELCLIMLRDGKWSKEPAITLLDHSLSSEVDNDDVTSEKGRGNKKDKDAAQRQTNQSSRKCCERLVEAAGLKPLFRILLDKKHHVSNNVMSNVVGILSSMLRFLPVNEAPRIRLLAKFVEKDFQALGALMQKRQEYTDRIRAAEEKIRAEQMERKASGINDIDEEDADRWLSQRLDAGLFVLQTVDIVLAWVIAEDDGARTKVKSLADGNLGALQSTLQEQLDGIDVESKSEESQEMKDILLTLLSHLT